MKTISKLTPLQFAHALELGLGRALLHLRNYGDDGIEETIKEAVLRCHVYDVQIEGLRTQWFSQILVLTKRIDFYADYLLQNFCQGSMEQNDFAHQFELASFFVDIGWSEFRTVMFDNFHKLADSQRMSYAGMALVEVAGIDGLEFVATTVFRQSQTIDSWECNSVFERACELGNKATIEEHLSKLAQRDHGAEAFWDACKYWASQKSSSPESRPPRTKRSLDELLISLQETDQRWPFGEFRAFGRTATQDELARVRRLLREATDEKQRLAFLSVFNFVPLPEVSSDIVALLEDESSRVRSAAARALSNCCDVREIALKLLASDVSERISLALIVLEKSYNSEDAVAISAALNLLRTADHIHWFGMAVQRICKFGGGKELEPTILWLYENGPDSFCRREFVEQLVEWQLCPPEILFEAQWDSSSDTQNFARENCRDISFDSGRAIPTESLT